MPTAKTIHPAKQLFLALGELGFDESYLRHVVLPDWWDDEIADTPAGRDDLHLMLARRLGFDVLSLREGKPRFLTQPAAKWTTSDDKIRDGS